MGAKSAAHWGAYLVEQGIIDPKTSMQIGMRGNPRTLDWLQPSYDLGYNVVTMDEFKRGVDVIRETLDKMVIILFILRLILNHSMPL